MYMYMLWHPLTFVPPLRTIVSFYFGERLSGRDETSETEIETQSALKVGVCGEK